MKILCASLWQNSWIPYWTKYIKSRGHEVKWLVGNKCYWKHAANYAEWADAILCMWAVGWSTLFSKMVRNKPLFVIHRSFEIYEDTKFFTKIEDNDFSNIKQLFMLNQAHFTMFNKKVKNVNPIYIKNGIDLDYWKLIDRDESLRHNIGWIANINHKKGEQFAVQAVAYLKKFDGLIQLNHLGEIQSVRIHHYLNNIAPYLKSAWYSFGFHNKHEYVKQFLSGQYSILLSSIVEGHPMNILEAMATGCKPLIHRYPGVEYQFPDKWVWNDVDDLKKLYERDYKPEDYRQYIVDNYDYKITCKPVIDKMEDYG